MKKNFVKYNLLTQIMMFLSLMLSIPAMAFASGNAVHLDDANVDVHDHESLQRGAKWYMNYCMGCHSLSYSRYNRVALDIGLSDKLMKENLIFTMDDEGEQTKVGMLMENAMPKKDSAAWFGTPPPDLSLVARSRGSDWIYTYLRSFYRDPARPFGANNTAFPNVGMPHVLWELQGWQEKDDHGKLTPAENGNMSKSEYNAVVRDLTNFLTYVGEPAQLHRKSIGIWVMLFLGFFFVVAYLLKKEYWKDVH